MNTIALRFTVIALALAAAIATPLSAGAEPQDNRMLVWLAASSSEPSKPSQWGRLTIRNGVLEFVATGVQWQVAIADIRRATISAESDKLMVIQTARDEKYYVAILGQNMVVDTPRKALDEIRRAQRVPAARR